MAATSEFIYAEETSVEIDNETLMNCVQNYRCIYDKSCSVYRVLEKKRNVWNKISESLNPELVFPFPLTFSTTQVPHIAY